MCSLELNLFSYVCWYEETPVENARELLTPQLRFMLEELRQRKDEQEEQPLATAKDTSKTASLCCICC